MKKNDIFTFTAPNGVEVTAVVVGTTGIQKDYFGRDFLNHICYAQNRLFTYNEWIDVEQKLYGEVIVDYAILPDYDKLLQLHSSMEYPQWEQNLEAEIQGMNDR